MSEKPMSRRARIVRGIVTGVSVVIILGFAGLAAYTASQSNSQPSTVTDTGTYDQDVVIVDQFTWGGVPGTIADAFRYCPDGTNNGNDVSKFTPCLNGVAVFGLKGAALTSVQSFPGYTMSVAGSKLDEANGVSGTYTTLNYSVGGDTLFAAAVRSKDTKGTWSAWRYTSDPSTNYPNGGYQTDTYEYQVALFAYDVAHESHNNSAAKLPQGFQWSAFIPQFLTSH